MRALASFETLEDVFGKDAPVRKPFVVSSVSVSVSAVAAALALAGCGGSPPPPPAPPAAAPTNAEASAPPTTDTGAAGAAAPAASDSSAAQPAGTPTGGATSSGSSAAGAGGAAGGAPSASGASGASGGGSAPGGTITSDDIPPECSKAATAYQPTVWPAMNKCYQEGKKKNPDLEGTVHIQVSVNATGKVNAVKASGTSELGDSVVDCMVKAIKAKPFDGKDCKSKSVTIVKMYGGAKGAAGR